MAKQFFTSVGRFLSTLLYRVDPIVRRNRVASVAAGLLLMSALGVIASTWLHRRAIVAKTRGEPPSNYVRQLADLRRINYYDTLANMMGPAQTRGERKETLTPSVRHDLTDIQNNLGTSMEEYRDAILETQSIVPVTDRAAVADDPGEGTYRRSPSITYEHTGGVVHLTSVDLAALGPNAGDYLALINKPQAALDAFRKKLAIDEQAIAADPGNLQVQTDLAYSSSRIGDLLAEMGDQAGALSYYQRAVDIYTKNAQANVEDFAISLQLARLLGKLAKTHTRLGYIEKAWAECNKAVNLLESVPDDATDVEQRKTRASSYSAFGDAYSLLARDTRTPQKFMRRLWAAAREMYERSLAILIDLQEREVLSADELPEIDAISHKIAECDLFLAK